MKPEYLLVGILTLAPRLVLLFMGLFTDLVRTAFGGILIPLLGFILLPFTTLAYVLVWDAQSGVSGSGWLLVLGGLIFDIGTYVLSRYLTRVRGQSSSDA
jgi:hypothetical protein